VFSYKPNDLIFTSGYANKKISQCGDVEVALKAGFLMFMFERYSCGGSGEGEGGGVGDGVGGCQKRVKKW